MKLYHGTSTRYLSSILENGIVPRGRKKGNWQHTVPSNPKGVYLTDSLPAHFAIAACAKDEPGVMFEIDLDVLDLGLLRVDEDLLEQVNRGKDGIGGHVFDRTKYYRKKATTNTNWELSLELFGTCLYYGVLDASAIVRYVELDWDAMDPSMYISLADMSPNYLAHSVMGSRRRAIVRWLFGEEITPDEYTFIIDPEQSEAIREVLSNRGGITVCTKESTC
jgi:hypothetical protein